MPDPLYLLYLDAYHQADPLFAESLARLRAHRQAPLPCIILHGSGEAAVRRLEAEGLFPELEDGRVVPRTDAEVALVEQALRQANRALVGTLTDAGVAAVGLHGADRGLLRLADEEVMTGKLAWLVELARKGAVPVVSTLARDGDGSTLREAAPEAALRALHGALSPAEAPVVVFFTRTGRPGVAEGAAIAPDYALDALPTSILADSGVVERVVGGGIDGLLTSPAGLFGGEKPRGTRLFPSKSA